MTTHQAGSAWMGWPICLYSVGPEGAAGISAKEVTNGPFDD